MYYAVAFRKKKVKLNRLERPGLRIDLNPDVPKRKYDF
jgi:hypothetical protein